MATLTKKDLLEAIEDMPMNVEVILEILDDNGNPYESDVECVYIDNIQRIIITNDPYYGN